MSDYEPDWYDANTEPPVMHPNLNTPTCEVTAHSNTQEAPRENLNLTIPLDQIIGYRVPKWVDHPIVDYLLSKDAIRKEGN